LIDLNSHNWDVWKQSLATGRYHQPLRNVGLMERETDPRKSGIGKTALVVDDSAPIRKMLAVAFLSDGFKTCVEAENGKEAIEAAKQCKPDLIVLDLSMPVMNGLQSAPELRKLRPQTPIILFSLYAQGLQTEASKTGINMVLDKAVPLSMLIEKAHQLMASRVPDSSIVDLRENLDSLRSI
jgi:two-component system, chemotaxis family, chemotaxis protein CheY